MSDLERPRAQQEAMETAPTRSSADRARLWAGMNRYMGAEARRAHRDAQEERRAADEGHGQIHDRASG